MFKKPPLLKPLTPLKSSARRSFLRHLQDLYPALASAPPEVILKVVPNGLKHCNAITSGEQKAVIYTDEKGKPLWFELGSDAGTALQQSQQKKHFKAGQNSQIKLAEVFPTIYTLWILPDLLPRLPTWPQIVEPTLVGGSALMIPGLIPAPNTFPEAENGKEYPPAFSIIAITPYPSPIPWVVARSELAMEEICKKRIAEEKGRAAATIHSKGDFLWEMGGKEDAPEMEKGIAIEEALLKYRNSDVVEEVQDQLRDVSITQIGEDKYQEAKIPEILALKSISDQNTQTAILTTDEIDAIMHLALLQALVNISKESNALPMPVSSFFSSQILPNRPAHWPPRSLKVQSRCRLNPRLVPIQEGQEEKLITSEQADIKHTSAKKLSKWIKTIEKSGLVKLKEIKGKDVVITSVNSGHEELKDLTPYYTINQAQKEVIPIDLNGTKGEIVSDGKAAESTIIVVEKFWKASASSVKLFQEMGASTSEPLSQPIIREYLLQYIASHSLVDARNQAQIRLSDPILVHALYPKAQLHEIPATLSRQELLDRMLAKSCVEYHRASRLSPPKAAFVLQLNTKGNAIGALPPKVNLESEQIGLITKGAARPIIVEIKTRQGRKLISLITGLEIYGIDSQEFAHDLMKLGASANVIALPGSTVKAPKYEVFVQGDQRKAIVEFLGKRGIDNQIVKVHDGTKK